MRLIISCCKKEIQWRFTRERRVDERDESARERRNGSANEIVTVQYMYVGIYKSEEKSLAVTRYTFASLT